MLRIALLAATLSFTITNHSQAQSTCGKADPQTAIRLCTELFNGAADPGAKSTALANRAIAYLQLGDQDAALRDAFLLRLISPHLAIGHGLAGLAFLGKLDWANAIPLLDEALKIDAKQQKFLSARGRALLGLQRYDEAIADFTLAIQLDANDIFSIGQRGSAFSKKKLFEKALADANYAIKAEPTNVNWYFVRAEVFTNKGDISGAIKELETILTLDKNNFQAKAIKASLELAQQVRKQSK